MKGKFHMTQNCLGTIRSYYAKFSEKEKIIADYILKKPEIIIHRTINEVADDLKVADATVFRFSKRIGFKGFQAMKIALASEISTPIRSIHEKLSENDNENTITENVFKSNIRMLQKTVQMIDSNAIKKAIDLILSGKRVELYGTGTSAIIVMDAYQKFVSAGICVFAFMDSQSQLISASNLTENDVAIIFSHSGTNKETLKILKTASETGAKTIGITSSPKTPISLNVDVAFYTSAEDLEYTEATFVSQIAKICLIDAICLNILHINRHHKTPLK